MLNALQEWIPVNTLLKQTVQDEPKYEVVGKWKHLEMGLIMGCGQGLRDMKTVKTRQGLALPPKFYTSHSLAL